MKLKPLFFIAAFFTLNAHAQIGINTLNPDTSAALEVYSNDKGMLIPRMSAVQRVALPMKYTPADGLLVYDTTYSMFFFWSKNHWEAINPMRFTIDDKDTSNMVLKTTTIGAKNVGIGVDNPLQKLHVNGSVLAEGNLSGINIAASQNITASETMAANKFVGYGTIPIGGIIMWSGSIVPDGWAICNGNTVNDIPTPDLSDRFIVSSGSKYHIGDIGGKDSVVLDSLNMPLHSHDMLHTHDLTDPGHSHNISLGNNDWGGSSYPEVDRASNSEYGHGSSNNKTSITINSFLGYTQKAGVKSPKAIDNRPLYYSLAFIMRVK